MPLFPLEFVPVASPAVARQLKRRNRTIDWSRARLLHEVSYDYWPDWIAAAGVTDVDVARGLFFSHTLALDAACEGQGVALAPLCLADRELARGALAIVDPRPFVPGIRIYLAWPRRGVRTLSPAAVAFRDWLIEEAHAAAGTAAVPAGKPARRAALGLAPDVARDSTISRSFAACASTRSRCRARCWRSRTAATGTAARAGRTSRPRRCGA